MLSQPSSSSLSSQPTPDDDTHPPPLRIDLSSPDVETLIVTPIGEADCCTVPDLRQALAGAVGAGRSHVIVDLDQLTFMDTSTLDALAQARARISAVGATMHVRCHHGLRRRLFSITGLDDMLDPRV